MSALKIDAGNFEAEVLKSDTPVLLDFWAPWCMPCKMMGPIVEDIAKESQGKFKVGKVNVDEEPALAGSFRVEGIPTLVLLKGGKVVQTAVGLRPKAAILSMLNQ